MPAPSDLSLRLQLVLVGAVIGPLIPHHHAFNDTPALWVSYP